MKKIKLLQIITKLELGGAQLSTLDLIRGLDKNSYEIYLVTSNKGILIDDVKSMPQIRLYLLGSLKRKVHLIYDLKALFKLYRFIKKHKFDIVHTHSSKAGILGRWAAKFAGVAVIIHTVHGWEFHEHQNKIKNWIFIFLEKITTIITDQIIAVSNYDINKGISFKIGNRDKFNLIYYGIDKDKFNGRHNGTFRKKIGLDSSCFVVGMIACFKPQKSPLDFIFSASRITKYISNVKFVMAGDGQLRNKIVALIERLNLKDKFIILGWQRNIPELISSFDVLVLTSLWEGMPLVFLEAMACGKPIVATNINGNREVIKDGINGFLVKPRDSYVLAEKVIYLFKNRNLLYAIGERGRAILNNNFELEHMIKCTHALYSLSLKKKGVN